MKDRLAKNYGDLILEAATEAVGLPVEIQFDAAETETVAAQPETEVATARNVRSPRPGPLGAPGLPFPNYTFEAFVAGPSNRFAHAAAMAVAEAPPSKAYNPLFIYGGVGLGKTHLLVAIGHHMHRLSPRLRVKYVTSESFMAEFIKAVRERQGYQFAARHRDIDVLLVDDIQFLAKREETQTEFFHTFNALHEKERQIVIASDRPPQELGMEERLQSRFRLGLCVDVQPPDLETRIAILQLKAQREAVHVPDDVIEFIASKFDQNIRELEGALVRVAAWSDLTGHPIATALAEQALEDLLPQAEAEIAPQLILEESARYFGLSVDDLTLTEPLAPAHHGPPRRDVPHARVQRPEPREDRRHLRRPRPHDGPTRDPQDRAGHARQQHHLPAGPGPLADHPEPGPGRMRSRVHRRGQRGSGSGRPRSHGRGYAPFLPMPSPCRRAAIRSGNRGVVPVFPRPYYYWKK